MPGPLVLSLETSTPVLSVALLERVDGGVRLLAARSVAPPAVVSTLVPQLFQELLDEAGGRKEELGAVVSGLGPGLFTGARVAVATMKALAYARQLPLLGSSSLEALALAAGRGAMQPGEIRRFDEPFTTDWLCPVIDARKGEVYVSVVRWREGAREERVSARSLGPAEARSLLGADPHPRPVGAGVRAIAVETPTPQGPPPTARLAEHPPAAEAAFLALQRDHHPAYDRARVLAVEPTYIRPPEAEVARRRRLAAGG